jgi:hypothetical protein
MSRQGCAETVFDNLGLRRYACSRGGTIERESKYWCYQHDPEAAKKRRAEQQARWTDENRQRAEANRRLAAERLAVGFLSTAALDAGLVKATFTSHNTLADTVRAVLQLHHSAGDSVELDTQFYGLIPDMKAALAGIPKEAHE